MKAHIKYRSFMVRLWLGPRLAAPQATAGWQGEVEHIQSGQRWTFTRIEELFDFLQRQTDNPETEAESAQSLSG